MAAGGSPSIDPLLPSTSTKGALFFHS